MPPQKTYIKLLKNTIRPIDNYRWLKYQKTRPEDFLLTTMQFSGTHWLKFMLAKALVDYFKLPYEFKHIKPREIIPTFRNPKERFIYNDRPEVPRIQQGHLPYRFPYNLFFKNKKVIFLTRDLRDALISPYSKMENPQFTFSEFLRDQKGKINTAAYGTLKDKVFFLNSWYKNKRKVKYFMVVRYEDLKNNPRKELARILKFLGMNNFDENFLNKIINFASLENMKKLNLESLNKKIPHNNGTAPSEKTVNKGIVGGYREYFSDDDLKYFHEYIEKNLLDNFGYDY